MIGLGEVDRSLPKESIDKLKSMGLNFYGLVTNETKGDLSSFNKGYGYGKYNKGYGGYNNYGYVNSYYPISTYQNYNQTEDENKDDSEKV